MDIIKRAMLGDEKAQEEITARGEMLPCPKCYSEEIKIDGDGHDILDPNTLGIIDYIPHNFIYARCEECNYTSAPINIIGEMEFEDAEKQLIKDWNSRPQLLTDEEMERLEE